MNDGFLYIWNIDHRLGTANLVAANKCTSNIRDIKWMGTNLITVGIRHVKIWRVGRGPISSPSKRFTQSDATFTLASPTKTSTIAGRNCVLGDLLHRNFTALVAISTEKIIICTDQGEVCLLEDSEDSPSITLVAHVGFPIESATLFSDTHIVFGGGQMRTMRVSDLISMEGLKARGVPQPSFPVLSVTGHAQVLALGSLAKALVTVDSQRAMQFVAAPRDCKFDGEMCSELLHRFQSHNGPIQGLQTLQMEQYSNVAFMTYSSNGMILFWDYDGSLMRHLHADSYNTKDNDDMFENELTTACAFRLEPILLLGDKFGIIR